MGLGELAFVFGGNWYDIVVIAVLIYGIVAGVRNGLSGEIILVLGLLLMVALALSFYADVGEWLRRVTGLILEVANLVAFVSIAVIVYVVTIVVRKVVHRKLKQLKFTAVVENIGGGMAGSLRVLVIMAWLTVVLSLVRSPFWHEQVARNSRFGAFVVEQFPAVAAVTKKEFPEKVWFLRDIRRREEPTIDESSSQKNP
jgi:membrane protein required for colicin V production